MMYSLQKRYKTKNGTGYRKVGDVDSRMGADGWMSRHYAEEDVRVVASCGCTSYIPGEWEECADHANIGLQSDG